MSYTAEKEYRVIGKLIDRLSDLGITGKSNADEAEKLKATVDQLDKDNKEFYDVIGNQQETMQMFLLSLAVFFGAVVDFMLLFNAVTILCSLFHLNWSFKLIVPLILLSIEVSISFFSIKKQRNEDTSTWLDRNLQYFVIVLLAALSAIVVLYDIQGYTPEVDGASFWNFITNSFMVQILLLIPSVIMHLWIIRHAEDIAIAIAYYSYRLKRRRLTLRITALESGNVHGYGPAFVRLTRSLIKKMSWFKRKYPDANPKFKELMPAELIAAINRVMGRDVFNEDDSNNTIV